MAGARFVHDVAEQLAAEAGTRIVLQDEQQALSGAALGVAIGRTIAALRDHGVVAGHRVLIATENSCATVVAILAASRLGAWPILVNARLTGREIDVIRRHAEPHAALFTVALSPAAATHARERGAVAIAGSLGLTIAPCEAGGEPEPVSGDPTRDVAALLYTSGTTGEPKGVMLTHANLLFVARESGALRRLAPDDHVYAVLPFSHVFGLASVFLGSLLAGARLHLVPRFDGTAAAFALAQAGITIFQGVPTMYQRLVEIAEGHGGQLPAPALRYISSGGAPLDAGLKGRVEALWRLPLHNGYGLTETSPTVSTTRIEAPASDDTVGPPLPGVEVVIRTADGEAAVEAGSVGEIVVRGPGVMRGYYKAPAETARILQADGWLRTGDVGWLDAGGNLYIAGRLKEVIIHSGFNVYPPEIEAVLMQYPGVALAAVVGRQVVGNEEVVAFIEAVAGVRLDTADLAGFAALRLAPYKRPSRYIVRATLPTTPAGKIKKAELAREAANL